MGCPIKLVSKKALTFSIFEILISSRYEKICQIMARIFGVFVVMKIVPG